MTQAMKFGHALPQLPQFMASLVVFTQWPLHTLIGPEHTMGVSMEPPASLVPTIALPVHAVSPKRHAARIPNCRMLIARPFRATDNVRQRAISTESISSGWRHAVNEISRVRDHTMNDMPPFQSVTFDLPP